MALEYTPPGSDRPAHEHAALGDPALHCLPPVAVHDSRLFESCGEGIRPDAACKSGVFNRPHLQQHPPLIRRTQHQLGAHHLHRPHRLEPSAPDRSCFRAERYPRQTAEEFRSAVCGVFKDPLQGRDCHAGRRSRRLRTGCEPIRDCATELAYLRPRIQRDPQSGMARRAGSCGAAGAALRTQEHDRCELEDHASFGSEPRKVRLAD